MAPVYYCACQKRMKGRLLNGLVSVLVIFSLLAAVFPTGLTKEIALAADIVSCNVSYAKPAICCDAGQTVDLSACGVQFSAETPAVKSGIAWTVNGAAVTEYTPDKAGVYTLTATAGILKQTVYIVAKNAADSEYVLYSNDFSTAPTDFRVVQQSSGATVSHSNGTYVLNASNATGSYIRVLLPEFLDSFGDAVFEARVKITNATDSAKWGSLMYRVQNSNYPYMQACLRYDATADNGIEISRRNESNKWDVYRFDGYDGFIKDDYNVVTVKADGVSSLININGQDIISYSATHHATGAFGFQTRAACYTIDYVKITLTGYETDKTYADVSFAKPALRCDIGETIDLTQCNVQFANNALYTKGDSLTWRLDGVEISEYTPTACGVTTLTASNGTDTRTIYVVTRALYESEYVLYYNDFTSAPTDFRIVEQTSGTTFTHNATAGTYVINASASNTNYGRVLLPAYLDVFGDLKIEASVMQSGNNTEKNWSSLMYRVQSNDYPYMQVCMRYNAALESGVEIALKNSSGKWDVLSAGSYAEKDAAGYNTVSVVAKANNTVYYINNEKVLEYSGTPYVSGAMGLQAKGLSCTVDYVKVSLGESTAKEDSTVSCAVSYTSPAICCDAGQTVLLTECAVQFSYGSRAVDPSEIVWTKDGAVISRLEATEGIHKLTASYGDRSLSVYVVAKKTTESEYVLYYNNYTASPASEMRTLQGSGTHDSTAGAYVLDASATKDTYVRVLLPEHLDDFGDYTFTASVKMSNQIDTTKWSSMMYRVQNADFPYLQACLRYDTTATNGVELSQKTADGTWSVTQKGAFSGYTTGSYNTVTVTAEGKTSTLSINGTTALTETATAFQKGGLGFQARGVTLTVDYAKVTVAGNNMIRTLYTIPGDYADVREVEGGVSLAPYLITEVKTIADFNGLTTATPAVAIMSYEVSGGNARVVFADGYASPDEALNKLGGAIIPAFRINDNTAADSLAAFLMGKDFRDAYAVSATPSVVDRAYSGWKYIRGVVDYSDVAEAAPEDLRYESLANSARVVILSPNYATRDVVTAIQDGYSIVWMAVGEGEAASVDAINKGVYGVISPDRGVTEACLKKYYTASTLTRRPNVIGHRGVPSLAQENSLAGAVTAYEQGATMVENDIYKVADGVLMVMHDTTIDRTTNGSGNTVDFTSTQLKKYVIDSNTSVATEPIPSLEEYFVEIKGKAQKLVIEIKPNDTSLAKPLADLINKYDILDQVVIISFKTAPMLKLREYLPGVAIGYLSSSYTLDEGNALYTASTIIDEVQDYMSVFNPKYTGLGPNLLRELSYRGVTVWPYTINTQSLFDEYFVNSVSGITTNYSQWSKNLVAELNYEGNGKVTATTYGGTVTDVSAKAELVVVEDSLGVSYTGGTLNVPSPAAGGKASFFFRLNGTTGTGLSYTKVTELVTVEVEPTHSLELVEGSFLKLEDGYLKNVSADYTAAEIKAQFKYEVVISDVNGNAIDDAFTVPTAATVALKADGAQTATAIMTADVNGDGSVSTVDYIKLKSFIMSRGTLDTVYYIAADVDGDGTVTATDYLIIGRAYLKKG